jgi:hypothetical protein
MLPIIRRSFPFTVVNSRCSLRCTHASLAWVTPYVHSNIPFILVTLPMRALPATIRFPPRIFSFLRFPRVLIFYRIALPPRILLHALPPRILLHTLPSRVSCHTALPSRTLSATS